MTILDTFAADLGAEHRTAARAAQAAAADPELAWHLTSSWHDVRAKAKKIVDSGGVHIFAVYNGIIGAQVKGDHGVYETHLTRLPGHYAVANFDCGCKWASFAFDRTGPFKRYQGRMCSHALALHYDTQSRQVAPDRTTPGWLAPGTQVIMAHDAATGRDMTRVLAARTGAAYWPENAPVEAIAALHGYGPHLAEQIRRAAADLSDLECSHCGSLMHTGDQCRMPRRPGCSHCGDPWHDDESHADLYTPGHGGQNVYGYGSGADAYTEQNASYEPPAPPTARKIWSDHLDRCDHCNAAFPARQPLCPTGEQLWQAYQASETPAHTAAAEMTLGETIAPHQTPGPHPTKPHSPQDNPASSGWATGPDPDQWSADPLYPLDTRLGTVAAMRGKGACDFCGGSMFTGELRAHCPHCGLLGSDFGGHHGECCDERACEHCEQPLDGDGCATCGSDEHHSGCCHRGGGGWDDGDGGMPDGGGGLARTPRRTELGLAASLAAEGPALFEATLHDRPEGALPATDGAGDGQLAADDADAEALTPMGFTAALAGPAGTLEAFQARAGHLRPGSGPAALGDGDVAAAARAFLSKTALKDFSAAERQALIDEGAGVRAANFDRLNLTGTHYAELEQLLAAEGDADGDAVWLA